MPPIVSALTGWLKQLPTFASLSDAQRPPYVRFLAACLALVSVVIAEWITGTFDANILATVLQTLALSFAAWVGSMGIFHGIIKGSTPSA